MAALNRPGIFGPAGIAGLAAAQISAAPNTQSINGVGAAICFRFQAIDTRDIKGVWVYWNTLTSVGTVTLEIQTIDIAGGDSYSEGSLYDAAATKAFTPAVSGGAPGWQFIQFDSLPTAGLVAGDFYCIVLRTTGAGTAHTLNSHWQFGNLPAAAATDADITSYNFTVLNSSACTPICCVVLEDDVELSCEIGFSPAGVNITTADQIYDNRWLGNRFILPNGLWAVGISMTRLAINSTPGTLYAEIRDSTNTLVTGAQTRIPRVIFSTGLAHNFMFPAPVYLPGGTYYVGLWQGDKTNSTTDGSSTARYQMDRGPIVRDALHLPNMCRVFSSDITGGVPTATTTQAHQINIITADLTPPIMRYGGFVNLAG